MGLLTKENLCLLGPELEGTGEKGVGPMEMAETQGQGGTQHRHRGWWPHRRPAVQFGNRVRMEEAGLVERQPSSESRWETSATWPPG